VDGRIVVQQEKISKAESFFRIRRTTDLGMLKNSYIILDVIRPSFFTKPTATAVMFTSVESI
jgi:hypothetical protein